MKASDGENAADLSRRSFIAAGLGLLVPTIASAAEFDFADNQGDSANQETPPK